ncbi:MAG: 2-oxo acid dehydrogenase subunit E2, partial [Caldilineae bacterium]
MATDVVMPQLGESIVEGTITRWLVAEGETVQKYAPLLEVATDKIDTEVPSPADGVLLKIFVPEGQTVRVGTVLAAIGAKEEVVESPPAEKPAAPRRPATSAAAHPAAGADLGFISPVVARLAAEHDVDLSQVSGTGLKGRITKKDVLAY